MRLRLGLLFLLNFLATAEFWSLFISMNDEAVCLLGSSRWAAGQWPYRDWVSHITPGGYCVTGVWTLLFGLASPAPRILASLISALTSLFIQLTADRCLAPGKLRYLPWLLWTTAGMLEFPILNYHWMATCAVSYSLYWAVRWVEEDRRSWALGLGSGLALAGWFLQSEGLVVGLLSLIVIIRFRRRQWPWWLASGLLTTALLWLPVVPVLGPAIQQVLDVSGHMGFSRYRYSWGALRNFLQHYQGLSLNDGWLAFTSAASHIGLNLFRYGSFPLLLLGSLIWFEVKKERHGQILAWALVAWSLGLANRMTIQYLNFLTPGWALLLAKVIEVVPASRVWLVGLSSLSILGWGSRWLFRWEYFRYPIATRSGIYYTLDPNEAQGYAALGQWLSAVPPGTPVLAFPNAPSLYVLYQLRNAIPDAILVPLAYPEESFVRCRRILDEKRVPWVIYVGPNSAEIATEFEVTPLQVEESWEAARLRMTQGYRLFAGGPRAGLYQRQQD